MRNKLIKAMLAVSALATSLPAAAQRDWGRDRGDEHQRGGRSGGEQAQRPSAAPAPAPAPERGLERRGGGNWSRARDDRMNAAPAVVPAPQPDQQRRGWDGNRGQWNRNDADARHQWQNRGRRPDNDNNRWQGRDWRRDRPDDNRWQGRDRNFGVVTPNWQNNDRSRWERDRWAGQHRWDRDWRRDSRYDWSRYRQQNRHIYRLPRYNAPYGWSYGYRPFSIGIYLDSLLFSDSYWIDDPWSYRLPPAYGSLRWIRYYDDALLVDIRDGYVVDVIRNFFW